MLAVVATAALGNVDRAAATSYAWDVNAPLPQLALERDGGGSTLRSYLRGNGLVSMDAGGSISYFHKDAIGSVVNLTSASGTPQWTYTYEPYGAARTTTQNDPAAPTNPIRFNGQLNDTATGLYDLRARQYDPGTGRFLATDPKPASAGSPSLSSYIYADNRPSVLADPSGLGAVWANDSNCSWAGHIPWIHFCDGFRSMSPEAQGIIGGYLNAAPWALAAASVVGSAGAAPAAAEELPESALVVRGGSNTEEVFLKRQNELDANGLLKNSSVNSAPGKSVEELSKGIPHSRVGVTTAGDIRAAGGTIVKDPQPDNPFHCLVSGISPTTACGLFTPTIPNPSLP